MVQKTKKTHGGAVNETEVEKEEEWVELEPPGPVREERECSKVGRMTSVPVSVLFLEKDDGGKITSRR
jgi:hypothetical protein